jgi:hypothetical protein
MTTSYKKKPFEKRYKTIVPVLRPAGLDPLTELGGDDEHQDHATARWLGRESFENTAAGDRLELVEYSERLVPLEEVNPTLADMLGRPVADFDWFEFSGLGRLDQDAFDWFAAEFVFHCEQWLEAERAWKFGDVEDQADNGGG